MSEPSHSPEALAGGSTITLDFRRLFSQSAPVAKKSGKRPKAAKSKPSPAQIAARKAGAARFKAMAKGRGKKKVSAKSVASKTPVRSKRRKRRKTTAPYSGPLTIDEARAAESLAGKYAAIAAGGFSPAGGVAVGAGDFFDPVSPTHAGSQLYQARKISAPYFNYKGQLRKPVGWFEPGLPGVHNKTEWQVGRKSMKGVLRATGAQYTGLW